MKKVEVFVSKEDIALNSEEGFLIVKIGLCNPITDNEKRKFTPLIEFLPTEINGKTYLTPSDQIII